MASLTWGAANMLKVAMRSRTWGTDSETDVHSTVSLVCDNHVIYGLRYWLPPSIN